MANSHTQPEMVYSQTLDNTSKKEVHMQLFINVKNMPSFRKLVLDEDFPCCILTPKLIIDPMQVVIAANKAAIAARLTTKTIFTEIMFNLSLSKNISASLQKFGCNENDTDVLVVTVNKIDEPNLLNSFCEHIQGDAVNLSHLQEIADEEEIKKIYKINTSEIPLIDIIVTKIAIKDLL